MYFKQCHEPLWWEKNIVLYTWRSLIFGWNLSFVKILCALGQWDQAALCAFFQQFHVSRSRVVPLWCFPSLPWLVQLGEVHWPYPTCPIRTATAWSPAGISVQWSGGHRSEGNDADDGFWNPLLRSVNNYGLELCICLTSSPFVSSLGGLKFKGLPAPVSANRLLSLWRKLWIMFWCEHRNLFR